MFWESDKRATKFFHHIIEYYIVFFSPEFDEKIKAVFDYTINYTEQCYRKSLAAFYSPVFGHIKSVSSTDIMEEEKTCLENTV